MDIRRIPRHVDQAESVEVRWLVSEAIEHIDIGRFVFGEKRSSSFEKCVRIAKKQLRSANEKCEETAVTSA
jgi:hypothetical protein